MGNYGIKIAKAGYDYDDGDRYLVYNSAYPLLKAKAYGSGYVTLSSGGWSGTLYTHSLGYKPMFYVWVEYINIDTGSRVAQKRICSFREYYGLGVWSRYHAWTTTTTLEMSIWSAYSGSENLYYQYVVFYDPLS